MADKRIIEQTATSEVFVDDWLVKDSSTEGTTKIRPSNLKDYIAAGLVPETMVADEYVTTSTYYSGDICIYEGVLYKALEDDITGDWDSTKWDAITISSELENTGTETASDVSYDNSSSQGVQATNVQDALDEAFQRTMDISTWFTDVVAENFDYTKTYTVGDYVFHFPSIGVIKLYRCIENTSGAWDSTKWEEVKLSNEVSDEVTLREELESATKVYGTPKNLPQAIATFTDGSDLPLASLKVGIEPIQSGSGDPSPSNVRPISGWDEAKVSVASDNLFNQQYPNIDETTRKIILEVGEGTFTLATTTPLYNSGGTTASNLFLQTGEGIETASTQDNGCWRGQDRTVQSTNGKVCIKYRVFNDDLRYSPTRFETSLTKRNVYTIDLDGTRYGGELDVVSGVLTVDRAILDLGDYSWNKGNMNTANTGRIFYFSPPSSLNMKRPSDNGKCTIFNYNPFSNWPAGQWERQILNAITITNSNAVVACAEDIYSTASDFKTAVSGQKLVYELATHQTYQLTPTQVKSLLGTNNVWGDCGNIKELKYTRNLNITINDLISRVEALEG